LGDLEKKDAIAGLLSRDMRANRILLAFPQASLERIAPHLEPVDLAAGQVIYYPKAPIRHSYFITRGLVSLVTTMKDGRSVATGAIGIEGVTGPDALLGITNALSECTVQIPGAALRTTPDILQREMGQSEAVRELVRRFAQTTVSQLAQIAACNGLHSLQERCCRWLLIGHDSARSDSFLLTHELLAMILGVQRTGISIAARNLQEAGVIHYHRGHITIANRQRLEATACECYATIRAQCDKLFAQNAVIS
jgi:CRP-like cAMP-binding protein